MNPSDIQKLLLTSDYPLDKIVYMASGSFNATSFPYDFSFNTGLPHKLLLGGTFSLNSDFSNTKFFTSPFSTLDVTASIYSDPGVNHIIFNKGTPGSVTVYYRVYGFMPDDILENGYDTATTSSDLVFNSELNYRKLFKSGKLTNLTTSATIDHNLGFYPRVEIWQDNFGHLYLYSSAEVDQPTAISDSIIVTQNNIQFRKDSSTTYSYYYRIYI